MCLTPHAKFNHFAKGKRGAFSCAELQGFLSFCSCIKLEFSFAITDLPKPACQKCPSVEEPSTMKTVLDAFCQHDFGKCQNPFR